MSQHLCILNFIRLCSYPLLTVLVLSSPILFGNRGEVFYLLQNLGFTSSALSPKEQKTPTSTYDLIREACQKHSVDPALVMAVIHAESQFDPLAISPKGAVGLMQLTPVVYRQLGIIDPFNPQLNIDGGVRYLKKLLSAFDGDRKLALAAYNAGPTQVYRHNGVPPFKETKEYLKRVFGYMTFYQENLFR
jgi:soluble lytic murein transglycosylase-like protein